MNLTRTESDFIGLEVEVKSVEVETFNVGALLQFGGSFRKELSCPPGGGSISGPVAARGHFSRRTYGVCSMLSKLHFRASRCFTHQWRVAESFSGCPNMKGESNRSMPRRVLRLILSERRRPSERAAT